MLYILRKNNSLETPLQLLIEAHCITRHSCILGSNVLLFTAPKLKHYKKILKLYNYNFILVLTVFQIFFSV